MYTQETGPRPGEKTVTVPVAVLNYYPVMDSG